MSSKRIKVKPGKAQSKAGFGVGIIFLLIGCFIVIPTFGLFGIFWTAVAGVITFMNYKNAFSDEGIVTHEIIVDEDSDRGDDVGAGNTYARNAGYGSPVDGNDIEAKLKKLESLYNQGLINHEEYEAKRKEFLDEF